jgi:eukaryotic-like serine/threonine-protein kinase
VLATTAVYQLMYGMFRHTYLIGKVRQLVQHSRFSDWITYIIVAALLVALTVVFHVLWVWLILAIAAGGSALAFYCMIDIPLAAEREVALSRSEKMLKEMRLRGLDENSLRQFVCKYAGRKWEEFYESLFGYEAKLQARAAWGRGERARNRPKYGAWRDPLVAWIDRTLQAHQDERQKKMLAKLESKALQAEGMDEVDANRKARRNAERLVHKAAAVREAAFMHVAETVRPSARSARATGDFSTNWMHDDSPPPRGHSRREHAQSYLWRRYGSPLDILTGRLMRFVFATILLVGFGTWWNNNGAAEVQRTAVQMMASRQDETIAVAKNTINRAIQTQRNYEINGPGHIPLRVPPIPDWICEAIGSWNGGLAGALMLLSIFFAGRVLGLSIFVTAGVTLFAYRFGLPFIDGNAAFAAAAGIILWLISVIFFRLPGE